ncbi:MAG: hypothetical protein IVW55_08410 [Chloroflexi bacterium]|nr:hypothetical protein [Chloroflexota bacterium]
MKAKPVTRSYVLDHAPAPIFTQFIRLDPQPYYEGTIMSHTYSQRQITGRRKPNISPGGLVAVSRMLFVR